MKILLLLSFIFSLTACDKLLNYKNYSLEVGTAFFASNAAEGLFLVKEEQGLRELFEDLYRASTCSKVYTTITNNKTLQNLEKKFSLKELFIYEEMSRLSGGWIHALFEVSVDSNRSTNAAILILWKKFYTIKNIQQVIDKIRICYLDAL